MGVNDGVKCKCGSLNELPISECSKLHQRVGFLEGLIFNLEMLDDDELRPAIQRGAKRYEEIQSR